MRVSYNEMKEVFGKILEKYGFDKDRADRAAEMFTDNSCDGVASHGLNRFPRVLSYIQKGHIDPSAEPEREESLGAIERWNGNKGMGCLNAAVAVKQAMALADQHGVGCVAIGNTNHWMRGASYGLIAAEAGYMAFCWTNTCPNMPSWGAKECRLGNNPLVMAFPSRNGPLVIDGALAQYSYGAMEAAQMAGRALPFPGGYDAEGGLTTDPGSILKTKRVLPAGLWKGAGYSLLLDLIGAVLSRGNPVCRVGRLNEEVAVTQVFLAFSVEKTGGSDYAESVLAEVLEDFKSAAPEEPAGEFFYPGERRMRTRKENLEQGIPVNQAIWAEMLKETLI